MAGGAQCAPGRSGIIVLTLKFFLLIFTIRSKCLLPCELKYKSHYFGTTLGRQASLFNLFEINNKGKTELIYIFTGIGKYLVEYLKLFHEKAKKTYLFQYSVFLLHLLQRTHFYLLTT